MLPSHSWAAPQRLQHAVPPAVQGELAPGSADILSAGSGGLPVRGTQTGILAPRTYLGQRCPKNRQADACATGSWEVPLTIRLRLGTTNLFREGRHAAVPF